jgi:hypothetical protein
MGKRLYQVYNNDIFKELTNMSSYWLGFLAADGYIVSTRNCIGLSLAEKDIRHIEKFREFICSTHPIKFNTKTKSVNFCIYDNVLKNDISKWIPSKKERNTKDSMLLNINDDYKDYFISGYFDGDGSIFSWCNSNRKTENYAVTIVGNYNTLHDINTYLSKKYSFKKLTIVKNDNVFRTAWSSKNDITEFSKLYYKSHLQLERKLIKYKYVMKNLESKIGRK